MTDENSRKLYRVTLTLPLDATLTVEAEDECQAEDIALDDAPSGLCHQCADRWSEGDPTVVEDLTEEVT
ncbi:hypothetical protein QNA24_29860 [Rhodococcus qingshengii]|uniref:hypothetical protein n=1 Tax=Rhodococcus TaxID=1827 RepID=UPI001E602E86|nr:MULTISPECIES: hypothetical protein [Rhodococcus]MCD2099577.1 hypothetical protein [Rhodococcus rhodochrous]MCD2123945.1 hypothetical protein [Rhodococcus rhodochrous]MCQ4136626.1 hypothetical protein [Rhodococcus rhodochrous]MDJ0490589.1 hypothetical protein [Rhodococcus qingshengii]